MPFPWGQSTLPIAFICPHCQHVSYDQNGRVEACNCKKSEQAEAVAREHNKVYSTRQRDTTFADVRDKRKRSHYHSDK